jgi:hypothetical protein
MTEPEHRPFFSRGESWYHRGWVRRDEVTSAGRRRVRWVYTGETYDLQPPERRLRLRVAAGVSAAFLIAVYLWLALGGQAGNKPAWVAYPCAFAVLPLLYFSMGAFWYVYTAGPMTCRRYYASVKRMTASAWIGLAFLLAAAAGQAANLVINGAELDIPAEGLYLAGLLFCSAQYGFALRLLRQNPMTRTEP